LHWTNLSLRNWHTLIEGNQTNGESGFLFD